MKQPSKRSRNHREWNMRDMKRIKYTGKNVVAKPESLLPCFSFLPPSLLSSSSIHPVLLLFPPASPSRFFLLFLSSSASHHPPSCSCISKHGLVTPPAADFPGVGKRGPPLLPDSSNAIYKKTKILWLPKWGLQTRWPIIVSFISRFKSFYFGIFIMYCNISIFILQV